MDTTPIVLAILASMTALIIALCVSIDLLKCAIVKSIDDIEDDTLSIAAEHESIHEKISNISDRFDLITQKVIFDGKKPESVE